MAYPLTDLEIEAKPVLSVRNSRGGVLQPQADFTAWNQSISDQVKDGPSGSLRIHSLQLPDTATASYDVRLHITGSCLFPSTYPRAVTCKLLGVADDDPVSPSTISSELWTLNLKTGNPPPPEQKTFNLKSFTLEAPTGGSTVCKAPFRLSGDFRWKIVNYLNGVPDPAAPPLLFDSSTRLELVWLLGPAAEEVSQIPGNISRTWPGIGGAYPINLLREFLPAPKYIQSTYPQTAAVFNTWWIKTLAERISPTGFLYDTVAGRSWFGMGSCGGSFDFDAYSRARQAASSPGYIPARINSFDLAALIQLGLSLIVEPTEGAQLIQSFWVCKHPFGKVQAGVPFGMAVGENSPPSIPDGVNNPYFSDPSPTVIPPYSPPGVERAPCEVRAWLEVEVGAPAVPKVVDLSWPLTLGAGGSEPRPYLGTVTRKQYANAQITAPVGDLANAVSGQPSIFPECFTNNDYGAGTETANPPKIRRIGVYNINGINEPQRGPQPAPLIPIPWPMRNDIKGLMRLGRNLSNPRWAFNDAPINSDLFTDAITSNTPGFTIDGAAIDNGRIRVTPGAATLTWNFDVPGTGTWKLAVNTSVFETFHDTWEAMAFELSKYERTIYSTGKSKLGCVKPVVPANPAVALGHYALQTPHSILMVRGNVFVEMTLRPNSTATGPAGDAMLAVARDAMQRLDGWLSLHAVQKSQVRVPCLILTEEPPPASVNANGTVALRMGEPYTLARAMGLYTSPSRFLVQRNFNRNGFEHQLYGIELANAAPSTVVKVTISGAHLETLYPGSRTIEINVLQQAPPS